MPTQKYQEYYLKRNFSLGILHGIFYSFGLAFSNPETVLVTFLSLLGSSKAFLGLAATLIGSWGNLSGVLPQLFAANFLETQKKKKPFLVLMIILRAFCWGLLALLVFLSPFNDPHIFVAALLLIVSVFSFFGGAASVAFYDIWAKVIPPNLRGRFFAFRQLGGGILAVLAGILVKIILASKCCQFPYNYGFLFLLSFIFISVSYLALGSVKEPKEEKARPPLKIKDYFKKIAKILKQDANLKKLLLVQTLSGAGLLAFPFYAVYAREKLGFDASFVGYFIAAQMTAVILSNLFWGHISDFRSNKAVLQLSSFFCLLAPFLALFSLGGGRWLIILTFFFSGFCLTGRRIGNTNFVLDIAPSLSRPTYIGLRGTLNFPLTLFPLLGGFLLNKFGYEVLFSLALVLTALGFGFSFKLATVRR